MTTDMTAAPTLIPVTFRRTSAAFELTSIRTGKGLGLIISHPSDAEWAIHRLSTRLGADFTIQAMAGALADHPDFDRDAFRAIETTA